MFVATMDTEHFEFIATGETEEKAKKALVKKFNELAPKRMTVKGLEEWYGINVNDIPLNGCIRL